MKTLGIDQWGQQWFLEGYQREQSDSWEDVSRYLSEYLANQIRYGSLQSGYVAD